jgi:hypothetical protein
MTFVGRALILVRTSAEGYEGIGQMVMKTIVVCLTAVLPLAACDGGRTVATTPSSIPAPALAQSLASARTHVVSGVVTAAGVPVAGAGIAELQTVYGDDCFTPHELSSTTTNASGSYTLPAVIDSSTSMWASWMRAYKPGYFTDFQRPRVSQDMRLDFVLDPWTHVALGTVIHGTVNAGDALCRGNSYGLPGFCDRFALTVPSAGTLEVTLTWPTSRPDVVLDVVRPAGNPCALFSWPGAVHHTLRIPVEAGSTYEIRVVDDGRASPLNYELTTALN